MNPLARIINTDMMLAKKMDMLLTNVPTSSRFVTQTGPPQPAEAYQAIYHRHPWVFACTKVIANNCGLATFQVMKRVVRDGRVFAEPQPDHPISRLLNMPSPILSRFDLNKQTSGYKELNGNAYWLIGRSAATGMAEQLVMLRPDRVTIIPDNSVQRHVLAYLYRVDGEPFVLNPRDVIHHRFFNPDDDLYGQSTLDAVRQTVSDDQAARHYNTNFYRNAARPDGGLSFEQTLSDADYERIRSEWRKGHGGTENAHKIAILEKGATWESIGLSQKDMDFIEARKLNREEIASAYGVPPVLINSYEHANYNTAKTQVALFWHETMMPKVISMAETMTNNMDKMLGAGAATLSSDDLFIGFDLRNVWALTQEANDRLKAGLDAVKTGVLTINELRERENLDSVEWGDTYWKPMGLIDVPEEPEEEEEPPDAVPADDDNPEEGNEENPNEEDDTRQVQLLVWKSFVSTTDSLEPPFAKFARAIFERMETEVLSKLGALDSERMYKAYSVKASDADIDLVLFDLVATKEAVEELAEPLMKNMVIEGGGIGDDLIRIGVDFDPDSPAVTKLIQQKAQTFATRVSDTTWVELKNSLSAGVAAGESVQELAGRVTHTMNVRQSQALKIARTEVAGAVNGGVLLSFEQNSDIIAAKQWVTAGDEVVRDSHVDVNGQVKSLNSAFLLEGGALMFPGDPGGPAEEVINCRCTIQPVMIAQ